MMTEQLYRSYSTIHWNNVDKIPNHATTQWIFFGMFGIPYPLILLHSFIVKRKHVCAL